uniref:Anoctamin n=1 Tax=Ascaris lumbricoides TaxID=6252 RepID=A0A0M3IDQ5_ASCLU
MGAGNDLGVEGKGLYYSYYKTLITASSFFDGLYEVTHDNVTEYGHTINTLKRFNLYPEVLLGAAYRLFKKVVAQTKWRVETCWQVNRGANLPPVDSCEGIGNQHYFYVWNVFALFGTVVPIIFFIGIIVGDSIFGGFIAACCFFFNHGEATRVQWTPPLRESFGYPVFILQIFVVTYTLRVQKLWLDHYFEMYAGVITCGKVFAYVCFVYKGQIVGEEKFEHIITTGCAVDQVR